MSVAYIQLHSRLDISSKKIYMNPYQATHKKQMKIRIRYRSQVKRYMCIHATVVNLPANDVYSISYVDTCHVSL